MSHDPDFEQDTAEAIHSLRGQVTALTTRITRLEKHMATIDELKTATDELATAVTALEAREAAEAGTNQATIDEAHANVTAAVTAINAQDQPSTTPPVA